jgi:hypothetical protein
LPDGTPTIEHVWRGIVYDYGSYTVEVQFQSDGGVDVIYNSGLLRRISFPQCHSAPIIETAPLGPPAVLPPPRMLQ